MKRRKMGGARVVLHMLAFSLCSVFTLLSNQGADCDHFHPNVPKRPWGPESTAARRTETYSSLSYSREVGEWRIIFKWSDTTGTDTTGWCMNDDTATVAKTWKRAGTFSVRALAEDLTTRVSIGWSDSLLVVVLPDTFH